MNGQGHVFEHFEELSAEEQQILMVEAEQVNPAQINQLYNDLVVNAHASSNNSDEKSYEPIESELLSERDDENSGMYR